MVGQLRMRPEIRVVDTAPQAAVAVMIADTVDETTTRDLRAMRKDGQPRLMLVATTVDDAALVAAAEAGVAGLLRRCDASADMLVKTILKVASGEGRSPRISSAVCWSRSAGCSVRCSRLVGLPSLA